MSGQAYCRADDGGLFGHSVGFRISEGNDSQPIPGSSTSARHELTSRFDSPARGAAIPAALWAELAERRRLSSELYDDFGQNLSALKLDLDCLLQTLPSENPRHLIRIARMQALLEHLILRTRAIASGLRPPLLDDLGLNAAVNWIATSLHKRSGIKCTVESDGLEQSPSDLVASVVYRIVQESLLNVERHAQATHAEIALWHTSHQFVVVVRDNGIGMPPNADARPGCHGLAAMNSWVSTIGGTLYVGNHGRHGAVIRATIPVDNQSHQASKS